MLRTRLRAADPTKPRWQVAVVGADRDVVRFFGGRRLAARRLTSSLRTYDISGQLVDDLAGGAVVDRANVVDAVLYLVSPATTTPSTRLRLQLAAAAWCALPVVVVITEAGGADAAEAVARAVVDGAGGDGNGASVVVTVDERGIVAALDALADVVDRAVGDFRASVCGVYGFVEGGGVDVIVESGSVVVGDRVVVVESGRSGVVVNGSGRAGDDLRLIVEGWPLLTAARRGQTLQRAPAALSATKTLSVTLSSLLRSLTVTLPAPSWGFGVRGQVFQSAVAVVDVDANSSADVVDVVLPELVCAPPGTPVWIAQAETLRAVGRVR